MTTVLTRTPFAHTWLRDPWSTQSGATEGLVPAADVYREGEDLVARLDLPGIDPADDITVEVEGRRLVVRGERKDQRSEESEGRRISEVRFGSFRRTVTLPQAVDGDAVRASYDAGVLTVTVPGVFAGTTPRRIEVTTAA
ncbi:Hsp20/alpha crystallin family protein [Promicromonospora thailandica]|uniref:Molecular chaperone IbpA, HSP20 family n=1 Tax=Promicromonospora thailandica TaxID=765201 RepID=A0A9X2G0M7_9MICO|nr:Hsp20/alpha crystallin family protein [Promicromonospora thailandica]MCP2263203.1 Molecular chaperone IbpA, HSP20 family [Promicromonospora thailandica]BFF18591.1 Hsp20/alpha crystallin family protein [Promicromonospora thailandica]